MERTEQSDHRGRKDPLETQDLRDLQEQTVLMAQSDHRDP